MPIGAFVVAVLCTQSYRAAKKTAGSGANMHKLFSYAIQVIFLVLPTISRRIGQSLQTCTEYDAGGEGFRYYLAADHTIDCDKGVYTVR